MSVQLKNTFKKKIENDPSRDTVIMTIEDICRKVGEGKIVMPIFQTGLRWSPEKIRDLLSFQMIGFSAISPVSMCHLDFGFEPDETMYKKYGVQIELVTRKKLLNIRGEIYSITDGQQRTTVNYKCYTNHPDIENFMLDLNLGKIIIKDEGQFPKEGQIPIGVIYNKDFRVFSRYIRTHAELQDNSLNAYLSLIRTKFLGYRYTVNVAKNLTEKQQVEWFEILNNAGSKVPLTEMRLSRLKLKDVDYHVDYISKFTDALQRNGYGNIFTTRATQVSYPLSALNPAYDYLFSKNNSKNVAPIASDVKESRICALSTEQLRELFELTLTSLNASLEFIENNSLDIQNRIEFITFTMGYLINCSNQHFNREREENLLAWFGETTFAHMSNTRKREEYYKLINSIPSIEEE